MFTIDHNDLLKCCHKLDAVFSGAEENLMLVETYHDMEDRIGRCRDNVRELLTSTCTLLEQQLLRELTKIYENARLVSLSEVSNFYRLKELLEMGQYIQMFDDDTYKELLDKALELTDCYKRLYLNEGGSRRFVFEEGALIDNTAEISFPAVKKLITEGKRLNYRIINTMMTKVTGMKGFTIDDTDNEQKKINDYHTAFEALLEGCEE